MCLKLGSICTKIACVLSGAKKRHTVCFFSVFSNSTSFLKPKCLEDPKLFPMLPSPPQHDRQRCPVPAAAPATAPTRIDSSSSFPSPQQRHWSLRHQSWGVLMASLPGDSSQHPEGREWSSEDHKFESWPSPSQISCFKTKWQHFNESSFSIWIIPKGLCRSMVALEPSLTNSNQPSPANEVLLTISSPSHTRWCCCWTSPRSVVRHSDLLQFSGPTKGQC